MKTPIESEILPRVEAFAAELVAIVRASMFELVAEALAGEPGAPRARRGAGPSARALGSRRKGAKRDPKLLEALVEKLAGFIAKNPGKRIEEIGKALSEPTKDLALPIKKLIASRRISTKGQRRATRYFPGGGGRAASKPARGAKAAPKARKAAKRGRPGRKSAAQAPAAQGAA